MRKNNRQIRHLIEPLSDLEKLMKQLKLPWMIIGGMAASLLGRPRFTADIDLVVLIEDRDLQLALKLAQGIGFEPRIRNPIAFARQNKVLLLKHIKSSINIDLSLGFLPFEKNALKNRKSYKTGKLIYYLPRPEDLIIFKAVAQRPQDLIDIQEIVNNNPRLDLKYIKKILIKFAEALEAPEIWESVKSVITKNR